MSTTAKDSLQDTLATLLTSHTPSGSGATGGSWVSAAPSGNVSPVAVSGGFQQTNASGSSVYILNGSSVSGSIYSQVSLTFPNDSGFAGVYLAADTSENGYLFSRNPGAWSFGKIVAGTYTPFAAPSASFSTGTPYTLTIQRIVSGSNAIINVLINGTNVGTATDSSSAFASAMYVGIFGAEISGVWSDLIGGTISASILANDSDFVYYGRWGASGTSMVTITNDSVCKFAYTGDSCQLFFDTSTCTAYPVIAYWVDGSGPTRVTLDSTGVVTIMPTYNSVTEGRHIVKLNTNVDNIAAASANNWSSQTNGVKFLGVTATSLLPLPTNPNAIEFLGDSITASMATLYAGTYENSVNTPEIGWPEIMAGLVGLEPLTNGHGGQGITEVSSDGTPIANSAFPYVYSGVAWAPTNKPIAVVIYQGTNDYLQSSNPTQAEWQTFFSTVRAAYPKALIFAINPFQVAYATTIAAAVSAQSDPLLFFLNYQTEFASTDLSSDNIHFNISGAMDMAHQLANDIQAQFNTSGIAMQVGGSGGGGVNGSAILGML